MAKGRQRGVKCLEIQFCDYLQEVFNINISPFIQEMQVLLPSLEKLHLSCLGHTVVIKMKILLRFLFYFQIVCIYSPQYLLNRIQKQNMFMRFISGNKSRIKLLVMQGSKLKGGMAVPTVTLLCCSSLCDGSVTKISWHIKQAGITYPLSEWVLTDLKLGTQMLPN